MDVDVDVDVAVAVAVSGPQPAHLSATVEAPDAGQCQSGESGERDEGTDELGGRVRHEVSRM